MQQGPVRRAFCANRRRRQIGIALVTTGPFMSDSYQRPGKLLVGACDEMERAERPAESPRRCIFVTARALLFAAHVTDWRRPRPNSRKVGAKVPHGPDPASGNSNCHIDGTSGTSFVFQDRPLRYRGGVIGV